ncbi:hypothetical protein Goarm_019448 [Gossypium armourianum]|uniref:J domain-containing protein n=1 Tax=Gossypium armourianum TaxID=34283 RepID=A0A7J9IKK5_9ROSI|nr:hypothetical protein [Gossypium armourianum]
MDDGNTTEAERWLTIAAKLLASGDFHGTRTFAIRARESAPVLADQILAVTDTLLTAQSNPRDWYGILQLVPLTQSMEVVESQYRKLAILLNPVKNTLSFADQAFRFVSEAWNVLSNPSNKLIYDNELRFLQFGHVSQLGQQHYQQEQPQVQQPQPQTQTLFMQQPPPPKETQTLFMQTPLKETQAQVTQSLFVRSPRDNNSDGNATLEGGEQLGLNNYSSESTWTRQINQTGLTQPSQINQTGSVGSSQISWPEPTRTSQINQPEAVGANQINQTELTRMDQINHSAAPAPAPAPTPTPTPTTPTTPAKENSRVEPTGASQETNSAQASQATELEGSTFWTACPHCYSRFEYPKMYENCTLRCQTKDCRKAFHAVVIPSPSVQTEPTDVTRANQAIESEEPTFWTACPYCYTLCEYLKVYEDCTLRCQTKNCRRAFHAVVIPPPPMNGKDTYICSWGFFPIGLSRNGNFPNRSPISTMFACPDNKNAGKQMNTKKSSPKLFYDEQDVYVEISDSSMSSENEDDDDDWRNEKREKKVNNSKGKGSRGRYAKKPQSERVKQGGDDQVNADHGGNSTGASMVPDSVSTAESSRRKQMKRGTKVLGKLDLNVEFRNEAEEPVAGRSKGNDAGNEEEDNNEGNGFFEGLDEFFSSLPILSVVGDDKVKASE